MALYFLDYDVREGHDYKGLYIELGNFRAIHLLDSLWCFERIDTNCRLLRDHFRQFLHKNDRLVISEVQDWAATTTIESPPGTAAG